MAVETRLVHEVLVSSGEDLFIPDIAMKTQNPAATLWDGDQKVHWFSDGWWKWVCKAFFASPSSRGALCWQVPSLSIPNHCLKNLKMKKPEANK